VPVGASAALPISGGFDSASPNTAKAHSVIVKTAPEVAAHESADEADQEGAEAIKQDMQEEKQAEQSGGNHVAKVLVISIGSCIGLALIAGLVWLTWRYFLRESPAEPPAEDERDPQRLRQESAPRDQDDTLDNQPVQAS